MQQNKKFTIESLLSTNINENKYLNINYKQQFKNLQYLTLKPVFCSCSEKISLMLKNEAGDINILENISKKEIKNIIAKTRRHTFNILQTNFLEKQFLKQRYINNEQRNKFSLILGLTPQQVND
ncbi:hypothetical protein Mgra_00006346 [Meloidogyne graminicola]|uniref:Homeobox domain-containing protein n=1 Tax=Meloidogyne graminicola TaxID=189291 RepID=A0A8S9ZM72_9BILA|nr:hypothetical protein Mgra_00006346 [Meloidogyne graminicola]